MSGLFSSVDPNDHYDPNKVANPAAGMGYDQTAKTAQAGFAQNQAGQSDYIRQLQGQVAGNGPSVAEQMLKRATDQNAQGNASAIASQRGLNPALASRLLLDQNAQQQQQAAGQGAQMRAGEQLNASHMLGQALGQQGAQNISALGTAGGLQNQGALGSAGIEAGMATAGAGNSGLGKILGSVLGGIGGAATTLFGGGGPRGGDYPLTGGSANGAPGLPSNSGDPNLARGGPVPGRAEVAGDSHRNDTVSAKLSPGEIVLPRTVVNAEDAPERAAAFVRAILRRKSAGKTKAESTLHHVRKAKAALDALASHMGDE